MSGYEFNMMNWILNGEPVTLSVADRGYVLETGRVVKTGTGLELLNDDDVKKAYLGG